MLKFTHSKDIEDILKISEIPLAIGFYRDIMAIINLTKFNKSQQKSIKLNSRHWRPPSAVGIHMVYPSRWV